MAEGARELAQACFIRVQILVWGCCPSNHLPKAPPPYIITLGLRFQHMNVGEESANPQTVAEWIYGNLTLFLNKFITDCRNYHTPKRICPFAYRRIEWMSECIKPIPEDNSSLSIASQEHTRARPRPLGSSPPCGWGHARLAPSSCLSCTSFIWHDRSFLGIVICCHKISVDTIKKPNTL